MGFTLSEIEGSTYEDLVQSRIFSKYQMNNSTTNRKLVEDVLVAGRAKNGSRTPNWDLNVLVGAGGILSSVSDLSKFAIAHFENYAELDLTRNDYLFKLYWIGVDGQNRRGAPKVLA